MPNLAISAEDVGFLIVKAREFDVKEANSDPDSGSNATDDNMIDVLEDNGSDPVASEMIHCSSPRKSASFAAKKQTETKTGAAGCIGLWARSK